MLATNSALFWAAKQPFKMAQVHGAHSPCPPIDECCRILKLIMSQKQPRLPFDGRDLPPAIFYLTPQFAEFVSIVFPVPFKQIEMAAALKARKHLCLLLWPASAGEPGGRTQHLNRYRKRKVPRFLFPAYLSITNGRDKFDPDSRKSIKDADLHQTHSDRY